MIVTTVIFHSTFYRLFAVLHDSYHGDISFNLLQVILIEMAFMLLFYMIVTTVIFNSTFYRLFLLR
jgi:hypothetical protein